MLQFARTAAQDRKKTIIPIILVQTHWQLFQWQKEDPRYFRQPGVWEEMKEVYADLCERYPDFAAPRNWFALAAFHAADYETFLTQSSIIGKNWDSKIWGDERFFECVKAEAMRRIAR